MSSPPNSDSPELLRGVQARIATLAVGSALLMQFIDSTALATALPTLGRQFDAGAAELRLVLTTYMIAQALFLPATGWAADRFGPRRVFITAMLVFLAGSILCALSQNLGQLVAARAIQGFGGSILMPVGRVIIVASSPREDLVKAMMWLSLPAMVGPIVGPPLAGLILSVADWPWIFLVNLPVGLLGLVAVMRFVPQLKQPNPGPFDAVGFLIAALVIAAVMTIVEASGSSVLLQAAAAAVALPAAAAYVMHARARERRGARPVLDLTLLRYPAVRGSVIGGSFMRLGIGGVPFLIALLLQVGLGWSPLQAGSVAIASAIGALVSRPVAPSIIARLGFRNILIWSAVAVGIVSVAPAFFRPETSILMMMLLLGLSGFARAAQFSSVNALAYADLPNERISAASSLSSVAQQVTLSLGVSLAGLLLAPGQADGVLQLRDFLLPFVVTSALPLVAALSYLRLPRNIAEHVSGARGARGRA